MQDYARGYYREPNESPIKKGLSFIVFFFITLFLCVAITGFFLFQTTNKEQVAIISPLAEPIQNTYESIRGAFTSRSLEEIIKNHIGNKKGTYAVVIKHMQSGESYSFNEHQSFQSASLYKLWLMAATYQQIEDGKLQSTAKLAADIPTLNQRFSISSESAEQTEGQIAMTVEEAIDRSITISHNYAALLLNSRVKISSVSAFLKQNEFSESKMGTTTTEPVTTAYDTALFYEKLYTKSLVNASASTRMIDVLKRQQLNDRIPKYLPDFVQVAHKTGELYGMKHDAGIVFSPKGDYVIVLMSDSNAPIAAAEILAKISEDVYLHFNK